MIVKQVKIAAGASLSDKFSVPDYCIIGIQAPATLTALTVGLDLLACVYEAGTPVKAVTTSGSQITYTVDPAAATFITTVGQDRVKAPLYQLQTVDASGTAKAQTVQVVFQVLLDQYLS